LHAHRRHLPRQRFLRAAREHRSAIAAALAAAHHDLAAVEVEILDAKLQAFEQPESGPVEQRADEARGPFEAGEDGPCLVARQYDRQARRGLGADHVVEPRQLALEDLLVEEQDRAQRLILGGRAHAPPHGEARQERRHLGLPHLQRVALAMEENEAPDPADVSLLRPAPVVAQADGVAHAVHELGWRIRLGHARRLRRAFSDLPAGPGHPEGLPEDCRGGGIGLHDATSIILAGTRGTIRRAHGGDNASRGQARSLAAPSAYSRCARSTSIKASSG
jgi:hypothetical protein